MKIGSGGFQYDLLDRVFYITFHKANVPVVMSVTNSNIDTLQTYADLQLELLK